MAARNPVTVVLTVLAYMLATFGVQGVSHFAINARHYAAIPIMRTQPNVVLGLIAMVIQGLIFAWMFPAFDRDGNSLRNGVLFSCALGAFLTSYIALAEAGKYSIPSVGRWIAVEASAGAVQFVLFGVLLGLVHRRRVAFDPARPA